ncbi:MAG: B12-binding domain-containing radical SAM protein [Bacteroidia bacterium]|nr:B12-binding domain-containing radical SAM protein [Bacteroidia bacterium]
MNILFTHSYFLQFDPKQVAHAQPYPPLGTILAAALIRENKFKVQLFDTMFSSSAEEILPVLDEFKPDVLVIYDDGFNYLTKMCLSNMREAAFKMQAYAKERGCRVIVTSSDAADHSEKYLDHAADFVIIGEAENTLLELVLKLSTNETDFENINGLAFKLSNGLIKTAKRTLSKNLDSFPLPAWDLINIVPYQKVWMEKHGYFSLNVATTRGCPYKCNWCAKPMYGNNYNMRSPQNVIRELKLMKQLFNFNHIWFCDDIFGLKRSWVTEFSELVKKENLNFKYKIQSRADLLVQEKYVEDLAASGCDDVWMGAESGSQKILDAMDKGTTVQEIKLARKLLKQHGIKASFFLQFGYLGETIEDIAKTINLLEETMPDDIGISVSYPLPGTAFYEKVKHELTSKTNWTDSDEMALMFKNTYSPAFYKQLHHFIHKLFRQKKAAGTIKEGMTPGSLKKILAYPLYIMATKKSLSQLQKTQPNVNIRF